MIDNFPVIDNFLQFKEGTFYKFELLVRNTDGNNVLYQDGFSNTNKNILVKSWYIDSESYYEKIKYEMVTLANLTGARLYVTLDRKDNVKLMGNLLHSITDTLVNSYKGNIPAIKSIIKIMASETSKVENSCKDTKTIMFDVDTTDTEIVDLVKGYIEHNKQVPYILKTKKGYHIFCFKKFNHSDWLDDMTCAYVRDKENELSQGEYLDSFQVYEYREYISDRVSVKENELGLVYHPMKNEDRVIEMIKEAFENRPVVE